MYLPFFVGLGGRISSGKQWFPWIHAEDVAGIYAHAIEKNTVTVSSVHSPVFTSCTSSCVSHSGTISRASDLQLKDHGFDCLLGAAAQ